MRTPIARFIARRLLWTGPVLVGVSVVVFAMLQLAPGDPALAILGSRATPESLANLRSALGLDRPVLVQYFVWLTHLFEGDFGTSIRRGTPVLPELISRLGNSSLLVVGALVFATAGGISLGVTAALRRGKLWDRISTVLATVMFSTPPFWLGILLIIAFAVQLRWFPMSGMYRITSIGRRLPELLNHIVLPAIALGVAPLAVIAQVTRSSVLEELEKDYVLAVRARGIAEPQVILRHVLRNAFAPILTVIGLQVGFLLASGVLVETVFSWPGLGTLMLDAILQRDFPVTQGAVLIIALVYVASNVVVDLLYAVLDPRLNL